MLLSKERTASLIKSAPSCPVFTLMAAFFKRVVASS
jgi:hypothetical protein